MPSTLLANLFPTLRRIMLCRSQLFHQNVSATTATTTTIITATNAVESTTKYPTAATVPTLTFLPSTTTLSTATTTRNKQSVPDDEPTDADGRCRFSRRFLTLRCSMSSDLCSILHDIVLHAIRPRHNALACCRPSYAANDAADGSSMSGSLFCVLCTFMFAIVLHSATSTTCCNGNAGLFRCLPRNMRPILSSVLLRQSRIATTATWSSHDATITCSGAHCRFPRTTTENQPELMPGLLSGPLFAGLHTIVL